MDTQDLAAYEADAAATSAVAVDGGNILSRITNTVRELRDAREDVTRWEDGLKVAQQRVRVLEEGTLPDLMREAGQDRLTTSDGYDVELGEVLRASIPPVNLAEAVDWLVRNGAASIVKREFKALFGKNEDEKAKAALKVMLEAGIPVQDKQSVHAQTLAATIRQMLAEGVDVPMALLGAYNQPFVKVKERKRK